jgi:hypothetical protein
MGFSLQCSPCRHNKLKQEKRTEQFTVCCLLSKKSPIKFAGLGGNGNKLCKGKQQVENAVTLDRHGPRQIPIPTPPPHPAVKANYKHGTHVPYA